jgi:hypothetical protein
MTGFTKPQGFCSLCPYPEGNRMKKMIMTAVVCLSMPINLTHAVQTAPLKPNKIVKTCLAEKSEINETACQSFVGGVIETTKLYGNMKLIEPSFCIPKEVSLSEMTEVYRDYIKGNRADGRFPAALSAISAFTQTYPCK